jgi:hypothetical protein
LNANLRPRPVYTSSAEKIALASSGFDVQAITRLPPLASSDEERLAIALAEIGRLHAELRLHRVLDEIRANAAPMQ